MGDQGWHPDRLQVARVHVSVGNEGVEDHTFTRGVREYVDELSYEPGVVVAFKNDFDLPQGAP